LIPIRTNLYRIPKPFTHSNAWHFPTVWLAYFTCVT
jgi:hypothetical protein